MHGLNQGSPALEFCINSSPPDIIFLQEHWQTPSNLDLILNFSPLFQGFGRSAMEETMSKSILRGRPYGGVAILINNKWCSKISIVMISERIVAILLADLLLINIYFPCSTDNNYLDIIDSLLGDIKFCLDAHPDCKILWGGDFNFNLHTPLRSQASQKLFEVLYDYNVHLCDESVFNNYNPSEVYTYCHPSLGYKSYIDFFLVSPLLKSTNLKYNILDLALNFSDHRPISLTIDILLAGLYPNKPIPPFSTRTSLPSIKSRLRWDQVKKDTYYAQSHLTLSPLLSEINEHEEQTKLNCQSCVDQGNCECSPCTAAAMETKILIEVWYGRLTSTLKELAIAHIPALSPKALKHWWSPEANRLKAASIKTHHDWILAGRPCAGALFSSMKDAKYEYKIFLKKQKLASRSRVTDALAYNLSEKRSKQFWISFKAKLGMKPSSNFNIGESCNPSVIANNFAVQFAEACSPHSPEVFANSESDFKILKNHHYLKHKHFLYPSLVCTVEEIDHIVRNLKPNQSPSLDGLTIEHIIFSHPCVLVIISNIFKYMLKHEYVPNQFGSSLTFPLPKDKAHSLRNVLNNYRGISINPIISKIFEVLLLNKFSKYLASSMPQFGFKKKTGTSHALYSLHKTLSYFTNNETTVNVCSLDLSRAFDKLNKFVLFKKLLARGCPINFINILENWYSKCFTTVRWEGHFSEPVRLECGVRQGGILSPYLFAIYVDDIIKLINASGLGCVIKKIAFNIFMYADDLLLLSPSCADLQQMINLCSKELKFLDMSINVSKSCYIRVGRDFKIVPSPLLIKSTPIPLKYEFRFLGMSFCAGRYLKYNFHQTKAKFYGALNNLLGKLGPFSPEYLTLYLANSKCTPILTYGLEATFLNRTDINSLSSTYNAAFVKVFSTFNKSIIHSCQYYSGYLSFKHLYSLKVINFLTGLSKSSHTPAHTLYQWFGKETLDSLFLCYNLNSRMSSSFIKKNVWATFKSEINV